MAIDRPGCTKDYRPRTLCKALRNSHANGTDLEFYIKEDCKPSSHAIPIHVPIRPKTVGLGRRTYYNNFPDHKESLWTLIKEGHFAKGRSLQLACSTSGTGTIVGMKQRKALAIRLILGLMISMDSDYDFKSWNPKFIHFLEPRDYQHIPFVSVSGILDSSCRQKRLLLPRQPPWSSFDSDEDDLKPLPQFIRLAKALLQVASGDRLESVRIPRKSNQKLLDASTKLHLAIDRYMREAACEVKVDREVVPFLEAASGCLDFHIGYQSCLSQSQPNERLDQAWKLVFDTILVRIDDKLTLEDVIKPSSSPSAPYPVGEKPYASTSGIPNPAHSHTSIMEETSTGGISTTYVADPTVQPDQHDVVLFDAKGTSSMST